MSSTNPTRLTENMGPCEDNCPKNILDLLTPTDAEAWLGDASIAAGDVKVESGGAEIDGGLEKRWRRAVAALGLVSTWYEGDKA